MKLIAIKSNVSTFPSTWAFSLWANSMVVPFLGPPFGPWVPKACARQGLWQQALAVFATAQQSGMEDGVMIAVTISACEKGGKIAGGGVGLLGSSHDL